MGYDATLGGLMTPGAALARAGDGRREEGVDLDHGRGPEVGAPVGFVVAPGELAEGHAERDGARVRRAADDADAPVEVRRDDVDVRRRAQVGDGLPDLKKHRFETPKKQRATPQRTVPFQ